MYFRSAARPAPAAAALTTQEEGELRRQAPPIRLAKLRGSCGAHDREPCARRNETQWSAAAWGLLFHESIRTRCASERGSSISAASPLLQASQPLRRAWLACGVPASCAGRARVPPPPGLPESALLPVRLGRRLGLGVVPCRPVGLSGGLMVFAAGASVARIFALPLNSWHGGYRFSSVTA